VTSDAAPSEAVDHALRGYASIDLSWISPAPTTDGWTLAPDALQFLTAIVRVLRPRHILELGSGLSTRVLARAAGPLSPTCVISSIDHDPEYNWATAFPTPDPGAATVSFQLAPLVVRNFGGKFLGAYLIRASQLATMSPADLVVIDGPPVNLGGREGALYQVLDFARPGTLILLDDAKRSEERTALRAWNDNLAETITVQALPGFVKGMAAILVNRPIPSTSLWRHRFALSSRDIERHVPPGQKVLVAGESWWAAELRSPRVVIPFTERHGQYWGPPADDPEAIAELDKSVAGGVRFVVFGWPAFWWLHHYRGLADHLQRRGRRIIDNDRLVMFQTND
jgi:Methyltransferase domain